MKLIKENTLSPELPDFFFRNLQNQSRPMLAYQTLAVETFSKSAASLEAVSLLAWP